MLNRRKLQATPSGDAGGKPEEKKGGVSRRDFLKWSGAGAAAVAVVPQFRFVSRLLGNGRSEAESANTNGNGKGRLRRWSMIIDLSRCDGCQSQGTPPKCTEACIEGHYASEPMEWIQVYEKEIHGGGTQFIPTPCQQCQNAPCVNVCPVGATFSTPEGVVLIDQERCIGCRICMAACPYDRRFFNWGQAPIPPQAQFVEYHVEHQVPAKKGTVMKCDFCPDMARVGKLPYCAQACPNSAIYYGDLEEDIATNGAEVLKISKFLSDNQAYQQKEDLGTHPRVYYLPGHGEAVGRSPYTHGRKPTRWPWIEKIKGAKTWSR
ncbi:MAG: hypothetical protein HW388_1068 [Dehalococcoidia bacterium]|nr:hypothetical protein [Dehalococcoidia bacterium]